MIITPDTTQGVQINRENWSQLRHGDTISANDGTEFVINYIDQSSVGHPPITVSVAGTMHGPETRIRMLPNGNISVDSGSDKAQVLALGFKLMPKTQPLFGRRATGPIT